MIDLHVLDGLSPLHGEERIAFLEKLTNINVAAIDGSDLATIIAVAVLYLLTFMFMCYVWYNHDYQPIRAKTVKLCTIMYVAGLMWMVGDFQMNGLVELTGAWKSCRVWVVWVRILSSYIYSGMLMIRFYALERIFNQSKPYKGRAMYIPAICLVVVLLAYCLSCQFVEGKYISEYFDYAQICVVDDRFRYASIGLMWVPWTVVLVLAARLRNIQSTFNERYESLVICILAYTILIKTTVIHATHPFYIFEKSYRQSETLIDAVCSCMIILLMLGYPTYQCMFRRDEYEKEWVQKLRKDGVVKKYSGNLQVGSASGYSQMDGSTFNSPPKTNYFEKDPIDTIHMSLNTHMSANFITQPTVAHRRPAVEFSALHMDSVVSLDGSADTNPAYPWHII
ncbi:hypothetical protein LPJ77_004742 [Coemansia sp. RSA 2523]|nr:hypothetical protein LPJ77_004742 [Coemansia sp. RSA 2523]KAJ2132642.1 hypothetical protein GGF48_000777 [Coemansia sp. RSA 921]KAJ2148883.1 hypothetical protein J3F82_004628 [Coemansia sp. RSA 637]KAJ2281457.1 hypothetical protein EV176_000437 [Coemansia sp. RSA 451]KAJ2533617.1 hypothetical protein GGH20_000545 [Coemansia sp. RSA 1937]KAJ2536331.1 hypothetical protein IWW43_000943 [Coemansia sp. RSA 1935]KAJ2555406.1 hypothetical protein IWW35_000702 [Coemansia sp. RSA 1878]KAJ2574882.1